MSLFNSIPHREYERSASFVIPPHDRSIDCIVSAHVLALILLVGISVQASADDPHLGVIEYEISCMPCHGVDGHGDGGLAHSLKTAPADLTQIAKSNGGEFPFAKVADLIDGRRLVTAHGQREMRGSGGRYHIAIEANELPAA